MDENLIYRVALNLVLVESLRFVKKINLHFASPAEVFKASTSDLIAIGVDKEHARAITSPQVFDLANKEIERAKRKEYTILTLEDEEYPEYLRETFDPPCVLYCAGKTEALKGPAVSIVGARKSTPYGKAIAERLARDLASRGLVIVSGLARGIDSIAHRGALQGGRTVAVLGSGLDNIYPRENRNLFEKIVGNGAVISEFPLGSLPLSFHFPQRNRIIGGLSMALVVVEATKRSGSLISARLALEQNREVMAMPGNITSELSRGTNWLIKTGAKLVEEWEDVVEELSSPLREKLLSKKAAEKEKLPSMSPQERTLFELLSTDSLTHIDVLIERSDFLVSEALSVLLNLELKGLIAQSPGKYFQRKL